MNVHRDNDNKNPELTTELLDGIGSFAQSIDRAVELLRKSELVAFPTETVYGLGARVTDEVAIAKIFVAKGRPADNPLIAHIGSVEDADTLAIHLGSRALKLMDVFFPGPLTLVCRRRQTVPSIVSAGLDTIAFRMPAHPLALELIRRAHASLVAPSANRSGRPSPTSAAHVLRDLKGRIAAVLDGGPCSIGLESTVISMVNPDRPRLLRPGHIRQDQIEAVLGVELDLSALTHNEVDTGPVSSPGMKYRHYAPNIPLRILHNVEELSSLPVNTRVLCDEDHYRQLQERTDLDQSQLIPLRPERLYSDMRQAEDDGCHGIAVLLGDHSKANVALMNRLVKAASGD